MKVFYFDRKKLCWCIRSVCNILRNFFLSIMTASHHQTIITVEFRCLTQRSHLKHIVKYEFSALLSAGCIATIFTRLRATFFFRYRFHGIYIYRCYPYSYE